MVKNVEYLFYNKECKYKPTLKIELDEAKQELIEHGYKVELNEDLRKAWDEVKDSVSDALVGGMRKLSPKVQQFIQDTIPLGAALKEAGTIYGFRVEKEYYSRIC